MRDWNLLDVGLPGQTPLMKPRLSEGRVRRTGRSPPLVTRCGKVAWQQEDRGPWRLGCWKSLVLVVSKEVEPQMLGALSVVLRPRAPRLSISKKVWCRSSDRPTTPPKKEPQRFDLATGSYSIHFPPAPSGISTRQQLDARCHMRRAKSCRG